MNKELQSVNHLSDNMYSNPYNASMVMTSKQVKETLLATDNFILACGHGFRLKVENIGAGMKQVSLKKIIYE